MNDAPANRLRLKMAEPRAMRIADETGQVGGEEWPQISLISLPKEESGGGAIEDRLTPSHLFPISEICAICG